MASELLLSTPVIGPSGQSVRVLFYQDGSIRFRIDEAGPMVIKEAFLSAQGKNVIIKVSPDIER